jgi:hypothetical protein
MNRRFLRSALATLAVALLAFLGTGAVASAKPILMLNTKQEAQKQHSIWAQHVFAPVGSLQPPAPPCPENGLLPSPMSNCGLPEFPATTLPFPGNMAYYGGHVVTSPKIYIVYWGWGESGAFPGQSCSSETISEGAISSTLACDPDGAGKYMADFANQLGGTDWAGVQTQYYDTDSSGNKQYITNPTNQLAGLWADDSNDASGLPKTSASAAPGSGNTYTDLAAEAQRAVAHFGITDLNNADIVIAQPPGFSDPNALSTGYCAFHDYTYPGVEGGIYNGIQQGIAYTNMPYQLAINSGGSNVCGENAVNSGAQGKLDGFSIVLGHEMEEAITDPGAEDVVGAGINPEHLGGWYDTLDANENGEECAWVGLDALTGHGTFAIPGALGDIRGNAGEQFRVGWTRAISSTRSPRQRADRGVRPATPRG